MREKILARLAELIYSHHKAIVAVSMVITAIMALCASRLELRLSIIELLDPDSPEVQRINYANTNFGGLSLLFVIVNAEDIERAKAFADDFSSELLKRRDYVERVLYKIDPDIFIDHALLFLDEEELERMADFFEKNKVEVAETVRDLRFNSLMDRLNKSIEKQIARGEFSDEDALQMVEITGQIETALNTAKKIINDGRSADLDAFRSDLIRNFIPEEYRGELDPENPYRTDIEGKRLLMLVRASRPTDDFKWNTQFMEVVEGVYASMKNAYPDVKVDMTGDMAIMRDERRVIKRDMKVVTSVTFIGVLLLFAIGFRGLGPLGMVTLSLGMGITCCFGLIYILIGYLNVITSIFGSIILGMGIDYAILILTRYREERDREHDVREALRITMVQTGNGIITGAVATAGAFYAMSAGAFRAADQMAFIAGNGVLTYCTVMMLFLPSLMVWHDVGATKKSARKERKPKAMITLSHIVKSAWPAILVGGVILFAVLAWLATKMEFEYDYTKIEAEGLESMELIKKMPEMFGWGINYGMIFTHSIEQDRDYAHKLRLLGSINKVQAISDFIPLNQEVKLEFISRINRAIGKISADAPPADEPVSIVDYDRAAAQLEHLRAMFDDMETLAALADQEGAEENLKRLGALLDSLLADMKGPDIDKKLENLGYLQHRLAADVAEMWRRFGKMTRAGPFTVDSLQPSIKDHFVGADGAFCIYAFPSEIIWNEYFMERNVYELKSVSMEASGLGVIFQNILVQIKHDFLIIGSAAFMAVFIVLLLDYRNAYWAVLTMIPLLTGAVMMIGMMAVLDIKLNFVNMSIVPLIMGIGIDYGVYMMHRWLYEGRRVDRIKVVIRSTGRGVLFSALTTIVGFGSLSLASYQGLQSLGEMLVIGITFCLITAVVGLPCMYYALGKFRKDDEQ